MTQRTYSIGEAARLSGMSVRKLRFYSDQGLLPPAGRTASGYRVFTD
ncbi:MerR family DNA-binding transcriptional regulator, partial [Acinetobacter baumannii]